MKFFTLALAVMALAVPAGLLISASDSNLMVDRDGHAAKPAAHVAAPARHGERTYAAR